VPTPTDPPAPTDTPSPSPYARAYTGKVDNLPDVAKAVLKFTPADEPDQTNSDSILERVANVCGLSDYVGSDEFPGTIHISAPRALGWVRVTWKPGKCDGIAGSVYPNPTLVFEISADQEHLRDIGGMDSATYFLTHQ
jgi:hypothetical protein